jgi:putative component of toxin-antitoxin plasmid stabilization module
MITIKEYIDVILLGGGTKKRQSKDIERARAMWKDYKRRKPQEA